MTLRTLDDAERYLDGFINRERQVSFDYEKLGLERIRGLMAALDHPEASLPCVHITGSKGKGSVALATECLLRAAGRRVGTFTSPHLVTWRERFRIDGAEVSAERMVAALESMRPALERLRLDPEARPSFFDVTTALGLELFRREAVDAGVIEVGLGGRIDSTNIVASRVSVLTTVELEHTDKLGDTLEAIAREKAGIMRKGVPFLHGRLAPEAAATVLAAAVAADSPIDEIAPREVREAADGIRFLLEDGRSVESAVLGAHQAGNLALAVRAAEVFLGAPLSERALAALGTLALPARLERLGDALLDAAHTRESIAVLTRVFAQVWPGRRAVLALSVNRDKDAAGILAELSALGSVCVVTRGEPVRAIDPTELGAAARAAGFERVEEIEDPLRAVRRARALCSADDVLVATGSFYFAGAVRRALVDFARATQEAPL